MSTRFSKSDMKDWGITGLGCLVIDQTILPRRSGIDPDQARHGWPAGDQAGASACLTRADTTVMSARPANFGLTLPMSCGPAAPDAATAAATSAAISASDSPAGM